MSPKLLIVTDLLSGKVDHFVAGSPSAIPRNRPLQRRFNSKPRTPCQLGPGLAGVEPKHMILVCARWRIANPRRTLAPHFHQLCRDAFHRPNLALGRTKVVAGPKLPFAVEELFC